MITLFNQFFPPDPAPTGQLLAELASSLAEDGDAVTIVCGRSAYAACDSINPRNLPRTQVVHVSGFPFSRGPVGRVLSWCSFLSGGCWYALRAPKTDTALTLTTPPLLGLVGTVLQSRGARHVIWEMDVYPDVATALGAIRRGSLLDRIIGAVADYSRRRADAIIALGPCMRQRLIDRGIPPEKIHVAESWADGSRIRPLPHNLDGRLKILYSGNLGLAHDTDTIAQAMLALAGHPEFHFTFAGGGPRRKALEEFCRARGISDAAFEAYKDAADLSEHLASCDIGLVTQNPATLGCVVPSKTYALMAAARPILFIGPRESTPALNIERFHCGWQIDPGNVDALVDLLRFLGSHPEIVDEAGARAYASFREHYDRPQGVARILEILGVGSTVPVPAHRTL